jgi:hypothetical protein
MALATTQLLAPLALAPAPISASQCSLLFLRGPRAPALLSLRSPRLLAAKEPELGGGGGSEGGSGGSGSGGAGGSGDPQGEGEGEGEEEKMGEGLSMSQKLTLAYAALVGGNRHRQHGFRCSL